MERRSGMFQNVAEAGPIVVHCVAAWCMAEVV